MCPGADLGRGRPKPTAVVVGGSVGGLSAALALVIAGWDVTVLERARSIVPAGAGLGLDPDTQAAIASLGLREEFQRLSHAIPVDQYRWVDVNTLTTSVVATDPEHKHRSMHWSELHAMLHAALPPGTVHFSHRVAAFQELADSVVVEAEVASEGRDAKTVSFSCELLVGADGVNSTIRKALVPGDKRRYAGMIAWRGVVDGSKEVALLERLHRDNPNLKQGINFDLAPHHMNLIYLLPGDRINWLWYLDAPEPALKGNSVTVQPTPEMIRQLQEDGDRIWAPPFAATIKATEKPFINVIYDKDPIARWTLGRTVLLGEAAHPTTPHGSRSTNMSIQDAVALGQCLQETGNQVAPALRKYEELRIPVTSQEVLFSRIVGEVRLQREWCNPSGSLDFSRVPPEVQALLLNKGRRIPDFKKHCLDTLAAAGLPCKP